MSVYSARDILACMQRRIIVNAVTSRAVHLEWDYSMKCGLVESTSSKTQTENFDTKATPKRAWIPPKYSASVAFS